MIILDLNGKLDIGPVKLGDHMFHLISQIQNNLALDKIKFLPNFEYQSSPYASVKFPEIGNIDLFNIIDEPPKNSSIATKKELEHIHELTKSRSKEDKDLIYLADEDPILLFYPLIKELNLKFDKQLFRSAYYHCLIAIIDHLKHFYNRARPIQIAEKLDIPIDVIVTSTHHTPSYPSGHTMYAAFIGELLKKDYPEHTNKIDQLVRKTGYARVLQGVHYPSDNIAAIKIVNKIFPNIYSYIQTT